MDKMNKLISDMDRISNDLTQKSAKIDSLESALVRIDHQLEQKDPEILSLKLHNSKDDTGCEFQKVVRKKTKNNHHDHVVTLIVSSNINGINPETYCLLTII
jgi:chromosome segregation ATPase